MGLDGKLYDGAVNLDEPRDVTHLDFGALAFLFKVKLQIIER